MKRIAVLAVLSALLGLGSTAFAGDPCGCGGKNAPCAAQKPAPSSGLTALEMWP